MTRRAPLRWADRARFAADPTSDLLRAQFALRGDKRPEAEALRSAITAYVNAERDRINAEHEAQA